MPPPPPAANWAALPADVLHLIFSLVVAPPRIPGAGVPLRPLARQWFALAGTCTHWAAALGSVPLAVELYAAPAACLAWLAARPVRLLHIASSSEAGRALAAEALVLHRGLTLSQAADELRALGAPGAAGYARRGLVWRALCTIS